MKAPIRVGLVPGTRVLYIERSPEQWSSEKYLQSTDPEMNDVWMVRATKVAEGYWLVPQSTNPDRTLGIFLKLYDNGKVERVTVRENEGDDVVEIKPEDGK